MNSFLYVRYTFNIPRFVWGGATTQTQGDHHPGTPALRVKQAVDNIILHLANTIHVVVNSLVICRSTDRGNIVLLRGPPFFT